MRERETEIWREGDREEGEREVGRREGENKGHNNISK